MDPNKDDNSNNSVDEPLINYVRTACPKLESMAEFVGKHFCFPWKQILFPLEANFVSATIFPKLANSWEILIGNVMFPKQCLPRALEFCLEEG